MSRGRPVDPNSKRAQILAWFTSDKSAYEDLASRRAFATKLKVSTAYIASVIHQYQLHKSKLLFMPRAADQNSGGKFTKQLNQLVDFVNECGGIENVRRLLDTLAMLKK